MRYFVCVAEELSFTRAAKKLWLAQPSLSLQIKNLEDELGVRLLERANNRITLTLQGNQFLADSKKVLELCAESMATLRRMPGEEKAQLNVGYVANIHYGLLPATLGAFRKVCPRVAINLFDLGCAEQFEALEGERIDLGFIGPHPALAGEGLISECVAHDTILVALRADDPLTKKARVSLADLASRFFVGMSPRTHPSAREWLVETCRRAGFSVNILQEADNELIAIKFVTEGLGVALIPRQIRNLPHEGVAFRPLQPALCRESVIAWRADNLSPPLHDYIRIVRELSRDGLDASDSSE